MLHYQTIQTIGDGTTDSDLTLDVDGALILDAANGRFTSKNNGTQFSVAGSAFAGMILGYTMIGESGGHATYTLTTSYVVPASTMTVRFIAPPSGVVEIMVQIFVDASSNRTVEFGLSDNATYNSLGAKYEEVVHYADETDAQIVQNTWVISGLTAGDTYNYWFGAKVSSTVGGDSKLSYGGTGSGHYSPFIMKVTALPTAVADFAVYD